MSHYFKTLSEKFGQMGQIPGNSTVVTVSNCINESKCNTSDAENIHTDDLGGRY